MHRLIPTGSTDVGSIVRRVSYLGRLDIPVPHLLNPYLFENGRGRLKAIRIRPNDV